MLRLLRVKRAEKQTVLWNEKPMLDFRNFFPALFLEPVEAGQVMPESNFFQKSSIFLQPLPPYSK